MKYILIIFIIFTSKVYSDENLNKCNLLYSKIKKNACLAKLKTKNKMAPISNILKKTHEKIGGAVTKTEKNVGKAFEATDKTLGKIGVKVNQTEKKIGNAIKKTSKTIGKIIPDKN